MRILPLTHFVCTLKKLEFASKLDYYNASTKACRGRGMKKELSIVILF